MKALFNLSAQCPQCSMSQDVSIDAMRAKGGWLRCSGCQHIFDGFEAMSAKPLENSGQTATEAATMKTEEPAWVVPRKPVAKRVQTPEPSVGLGGQGVAGMEDAPRVEPMRVEHPMSSAPLEPWEVAGGDPLEEQPLEQMVCLPIEASVPVHVPVPQSMQDEDFVVEWSSEAMVASMGRSIEPVQIKFKHALPPDAPSALQGGGSSPAPWQTRKRALRVGAPTDEAVGEVIDSRTTKADWERDAEQRKEAMRKAMESGGSWLHSWGTRAMGGQYAWSRIIGAPKSKGWRIGMGLTCLGLMAISAVQGAYFYKEQIAAYNPQARPFMEKACKAIGCEVGLGQAKSEVDLDGAQVLLDEQGRLVFTATLRSRADIESKAPRLWLALEGDDGEIVASRIMEPEQWVGSKSIKPGQEMEAKLTFPPIKEGLSGFKARLVWGARSDSLGETGACQPTSGRCTVNPV